MGFDWGRVEGVYVTVLVLAELGFEGENIKLEFATVRLLFPIFEK
jgi:hypothetical protein